MGDFVTEDEDMNNTTTHNHSQMDPEAMTGPGVCEDCDPSISDPTNTFVVATDRAEDEPCEAGTVGCCVNHGRSEIDRCETW